MAKKRPKVELYSYGIYEPWERDSKKIPSLKEITTKIPIVKNIEFGYVIKIKKGKGSKIDFIINHPPFIDKSGEIAPPFSGREYVNSNDWEFFLGDTVWEPYEDKIGTWELITWLNDKEIARKNFTLYLKGNN
ncbi:DUF3859 domain-containing protein [Marinilabiliaceae bacterium ANBcel2]|nr:DUF3859 domain-containing protein [Marinilabiliaceae bacterium ANBcel2]